MNYICKYTCNRIRKNIKTALDTFLSVNQLVSETQMKKYLLLIIGTIFFISCGKKVEIEVFNNSEVDRVKEMVEICLCQLEGFTPSSIVIYNENGKTVPYQLLYKGADEPKALLFSVTLKAGVQSVFTLKEGSPEKSPVKTNVRLVTERKDDMSWENDRIGFRMYGPGSKFEYQSNGVDVWLKKTKDLVLDKWYKNNTSNKASYFQDHGEGLDCYNLKQSLGAGGITPYSKDSFWTAPHFDRYKILDNGPLRSSFVLYYDALKYGSKKLQAEMMITLDAGSNLNQAVVVYKGDTSQIRLAAGVYLHDSVQSLDGVAAHGYIGYGENVYTQDLTKVSAGRCYTGVVFEKEIPLVKKVKGHCVAIFNYKMGQEFKYYFGAGWNKFGFKNDSDWFQYLSNKRIALTQPLKVRILK